MKNMLKRNEKKIFTIFSKILVTTTNYSTFGICWFNCYEIINPNLKHYKKNG